LQERNPARGGEGAAATAAGGEGAAPAPGREGGGGGAWWGRAAAAPSGQGAAAARDGDGPDWLHAWGGGMACGGRGAVGVRSRRKEGPNIFFLNSRPNAHGGQVV
jgi:hypothetical protein